MTTKPTETLKAESPEIEVLPALHERAPQTERSHVYDKAIGAQIRTLATFGLSKGNVALGARVTQYIFEKYYLQDFLDGQAEMQRGLAKVAVEEAMNGNTPVLLHLIKTKLGWNEMHQLEVSGEVRSVVSAKPLTKEEFVQRYLSSGDEGSDG